jgi:carboxymethylenebutenolidase
VKGGVVLMQEWWGVVPHIKEVADRLAGLGYVTVAPDFYNGKETTEPDEAQKYLLELRMDEAAQLIKDAAAFLVARDDVTAPVAAVGFCMGGGLALLAGSASDDIGVTVGFYPAIYWPDYNPDLSKYAGKTALVHASQEDGGSGVPKLVALGEGIAAAGGSYTAYDYPGTKHAFFNDTRPEVYDAEASKLAWDRTLEAFATL